MNENREIQMLRRHDSVGLLPECRTSTGKMIKSRLKKL